MVGDYLNFETLWLIDIGSYFSEVIVFLMQGTVVYLWNQPEQLVEQFPARQAKWFSCSRVKLCWIEGLESLWARLEGLFAKQLEGGRESLSGVQVAVNGAWNVNNYETSLKIFSLKNCEFSLPVVIAYENNCFFKKSYKVWSEKIHTSFIWLRHIAKVYINF